MTLIVSTISDTALKTDIRFPWKEEDMKELLSQTRGYQNRLRSLLDSFDKTDTPRKTSERTIGNQSALINLLNRSHSSFQIRPNSNRSSLPHSFVSLDPSPPYALSLNSDAIGEIKRTAEDISSYASENKSLFVIGQSKSSLTGESVIEETMASNENDGLRGYDESSNLWTSKSKSSPALAVVMENFEEEDRYDPRLTVSSQAHIHDAESRTSLTENSSNINGKVASRSQSVAILAPSQSATQPVEAAAPSSKDGSVIQYTIAVAGSEDSGKTDLVNWFLHRGVDQEVISLENNNRLCKIDDAHVVVDIIDNSGQEYYDSMRFNYLNKAEGYLLVYEASSRNSFNEVRQIQSMVSKLTDVTKVTDGRARYFLPPTLLVAHNVESEAERQVSHRERQGIADESSCTFVSIDGKDYSSVEKAVYDVIRLIRKQYMQYSSETDHDSRFVSDRFPAVAKMTKAHSVLKREERSLARKTLGDIWTRRRG